MINKRILSFFSAIATNYPQYVQETLVQDRSMIDALEPYSGRPPLYNAIAFNDRHMFDLLIQYEPDVTVVDHYGLSVIHYAMFYDRLFGSNFTRKLCEYKQYTQYDNKDVDKWKEFEKQMWQEWDMAHQRSMIPLHVPDDED